MGDRVSISFKDNDGDESVTLFHHWGGTNFPKVALEWFKGFKKDINSTAKENSSNPTTRFEARNIMAQFLQWIGKNNHYRECIGFEKDENGNDMEWENAKPIYSDDQLSHSIYFGKDQNDGDNSDNGHYVINTHDGEMQDDKGQFIS